MRCKMGQRPGGSTMANGWRHATLSHYVTIPQHIRGQEASFPPRHAEIPLGEVISSLTITRYNLPGQVECV